MAERTKLMDVKKCLSYFHKIWNQVGAKGFSVCAHIMKCFAGLLSGWAMCLFFDIHEA